MKSRHWTFAFLTALLIACSAPESKKDIFMPLPEQVIFNSYQFDGKTGLLKLKTDQDISLPAGMSGLLSVFTHKHKDSLYFDFQADTCLVTSRNTVEIRLTAPKVMNREASEASPDILSDLRSGKDSIETIYLDLFHPSVNFYSHSGKDYIKRPFIGNVLWSGGQRLNNSDTLYLYNRSTPRNIWDSIAGLVDPNCKKYCLSDE